jgi:hypothetical protein
MSDAGSMQSIEQRSPYGGDPFGGIDDMNKTTVEFVSHPIVDPAASQEAGRSVYVKADYIRIHHKFEKDEIFRPAHDGDKQRFKRQWEAYLCGEDATPIGTPLSVLFPRNPEIIKNLEQDKVRTIEELAALNDTQIQNIGIGGRQFTDRAKAFLSSSTDERIKALEALLAEVKAKEKR